MQEAVNLSGAAAAGRHCSMSLSAHMAVYFCPFAFFQKAMSSIMSLSISRGVFFATSLHLQLSSVPSFISSLGNFSLFTIPFPGASDGFLDFFIHVPLIYSTLIRDKSSIRATRDVYRKPASCD